MMMIMNSSRGMWSTITVFLACMMVSWNEVKGHGRLIEPPSRSSMWRYGFNTTANYNDHELYCGGFARQHQKNSGKCGVCGDPWDGSKPNEAGGTYAQGIIVRKYRQNSIIRIKVELTANHKGYFEFRLCPNNNPKKVVSQKCLDKYTLKQANGEGPRYYPGEGTKVFESRYLLPKDMTCTQCVLQWRYLAANSWGGPCSNGTKEGLGCGPQEEFRACSDVAIYDDKGYASAEEVEIIDKDEEDNVVDVDKLEGGNTSTEISIDETADRSEPSVWPFIMALIALMFAALGFGSLLGWFYRKEILQFFGDTMSRARRKMGSSDGFINGQNGGPPVPPPRHKKFHTINPSTGKGEKRHITPDVISQPMHVTINGLAV
ncbi:unnamed protein product [Orchesella dallaii]|uniref:Chitin-binding type-4 domain-containing protein n=1 Tax=Orchesella dallaii TaxID=48710 RepID=A0ABP1PUB2_9HEXA